MTKVDEMAPPAAGPLTGVKVLDLSRFISGPMAGSLLAEMGAEVIKVERPGGEDSRTLGPSVNGMSLYTMNYNRNKRAVTLNTRAPQGRELLTKLVQWADVVIENYRPGTMEQMGFGYERLNELKPGIILTSVSGFGQTGPWSERPLFDFLSQALSGLMSLNGTDEDPPLLTGVFISDCVTAIYAAFGTTLALLEKQRSGRGQVVDVALLDSIFSCMGTAVPAYMMAGLMPERFANKDPWAAPAKVFTASDGRAILVAAGTDALFPRMAGLLGHPEMASDPKFNSVEARVVNRVELEGMIEEWVAARDAQSAQDALSAAGIPCGIVADIPAAIRNPQLLAREMLVETRHPTVGRTVQPGVTVKLSRTPGAITMPPALPGEHNRDIYCGLLGLSEDELRDCEAAGAV
jgi:crotonobetainyl-CoA:carnitine CoA-transferase CaiB-like acyl-CoA transferase